jgi:hypothetical protein
MRKPAAAKTTATAAAAAPAAKPAAKAASSSPVKPAATPAKPGAKKTAAAAPKDTRKPAASAPPTGAAAEPVREKARKAKLVRDSFTMPEHEYEMLGQVKKACLKAGFEIKKSELLRIGVALISQMDLATLQKVLASLPQLKTGRPKNA